MKTEIDINKFAPYHGCKKGENRKPSFYGKAKIITENGEQILVSYGTKVCKVNGKRFIRLWGDYSKTTSRHISAFCKALKLSEDYGRKAVWESLKVA